MTDPPFVGADGTPDGWIAVRYDREEFRDVRRYDDAEELWKKNAEAETVLVDVPIGLREGSAESRVPDSEARDRLGWPRSSSVFSVPIREAVHADSYESAKEIQEDRTDGSLGRQSYNITNLIAEIDDLLTDPPDDLPNPRGTLREAHPEVCFYVLADGEPMANSKTGQPAPAFWERVRVLENVDEDFETALFSAGGHIAEWDTSASNDDLLDAFALAVTASDMTDELQTLPDDPPTDEKELPMEMVYAEP